MLYFLFYVNNFLIRLITMARFAKIYYKKEGFILVKKSSILIILLAFISLSLGGYITYEKLIKKDNVKEKEVCQCTECIECEVCGEKDLSYLNNIVETDIPIKCVIDMTGLTEINIYKYSGCSDDFYPGIESYQVTLTNLDYNGVTYTFTYILVRDRVIEANNISIFDNPGFVKLYIGDKLIDAHYALYRNTFYSLKADGDILNIEEIYPSDVPARQSTFDLNKLIY